MGDEGMYMRLDRNEIAAELRDDITTGKYSAGDKLPAYRDLATKFGAAPNTIGEAVRMLADEGLVQLKKTSRAVVLPLESIPSPDAQSAREDLHSVQTELREVRERLADLEKQVADALGKLPR